jgi:NAD(P)-binding Rossmann-like domain
MLRAGIVLFSLLACRTWAFIQRRGVLSPVQKKSHFVSSFRHSAITPERVIGLDAPESLVAKSASELESVSEVDYVVIGSGIGGLSCAALLTYYGYSVVVLESHYLPGGVAHTFERDGFYFDAGPSLWNGMATRPYNPLREVKCIVDMRPTRYPSQLQPPLLF